MNPNNNYPVFEHWYNTMNWILDKCERMPKNARFTIANRMANLAIDTVEQITEAIYRKDKQIYLIQANLNLEKLRIFFRLVHDRRYISTQQLGYISKEINTTGKMIGGWLKSCKK